MKVWLYHQFLDVVVLIREQDRILAKMLIIVKLLDICHSASIVLRRRKFSSYWEASHTAILGSEYRSAHDSATILFAYLKSVAPYSKR